jgi:hypothetical protein
MLDEAFEQTKKDESNWPPLPHPDPLSLYKDFHGRILKKAHNLVCGSCGCIYHDHDEIM